MKTADDILEEHCTTVFNTYTGDEEIESSRSAVLIAMEDYATERIAQLHKTTVGDSLTDFIEWYRNTDINVDGHSPESLTEMYRNNL